MPSASRSWTGGMRPADDARGMVALGVGRGRPALGGAVALEHDDAQVLPGLLEVGRQVGARGHEQPQLAAQLLVDATGTAAAART